MIWEQLKQNYIIYVALSYLEYILGNRIGVHCTVNTIKIK